MLGNGVVSLRDPVSRSQLLQIWTIEGRQIPAPAGDFVFLYPKGVVDQSGRLTVLWGEPAVAPEQHDSLDWIPLMMRSPGSIWAATFVSGTGWSEPRKLYTGPVEWSKSATDQISRVDSTLTLAVARDASQLLTGGMLLISLDGNRQEVREIPATNMAGGPSTWTSGAVTYVAYISAADGTIADENSVFLTRSADAGKTWSGKTLVQRSGRLPANDVRVRVGDDGSVHLVWIQKLANGTTALRHVVSRDGGQTSSTPDDLPLQGQIEAPQIAIDGCGNLHVILYNNTEPAAPLDHVTWDGRWSSAEHLFPNLRAFDAALARLQDGSLALAMVAAPAGAPLDGRNQSFVSVWR